MEVERREGVYSSISGHGVFGRERGRDKEYDR